MLGLLQGVNWAADGSTVILFVGDIVKLKTGETAAVIEISGVVRTWYKLRTSNNAIIFTMSDDIESVIKRFSNKKRSWGK